MSLKDNEQSNARPDDDARMNPMEEYLAQSRRDPELAIPIHEVARFMGRSLQIEDEGERRDIDAFKTRSITIGMDEEEYSGSLLEVTRKSQRARKQTSKGMQYHVSIMKEKRNKMHSRLTRKSTAVQDLLYTSRNIVAVEEEMGQYNDILKMLMSLNDEYAKMLDAEEQIKNDEWVELLDEEVFNFKRGINIWLKNAEEDQSLKASSKFAEKISSKKSIKSSSSKTLCSSIKTMDSHARKLLEKAKLAELLAEESFLERRQQAKNEAQRLKIQEELAKAKARSQVYEDLPTDKLKIPDDKGVNENIEKYRSSCNRG